MPARYCSWCSGGPDPRKLRENALKAVVRTRSFAYSGVYSSSTGMKIDSHGNNAEKRLPREYVIARAAKGTDGLGQASPWTHHP